MVRLSFFVVLFLILLLDTGHTLAKATSTIIVSNFGIMASHNVVRVFDKQSAFSYSIDFSIVDNNNSRFSAVDNKKCFLTVYRVSQNTRLKCSFREYNTVIQPVD